LAGVPKKEVWAGRFLEDNAFIICSLKRFCVACPAAITWSNCSAEMLGEELEDELADSVDILSEDK
jgi:hypothetical protein